MPFPLRVRSSSDALLIVRRGNTCGNQASPHAYGDPADFCLDQIALFFFGNLRKVAQVDFLGGLRLERGLNAQEMLDCSFKENEKTVSHPLLMELILVAT